VPISDPGGAVEDLGGGGLDFVVEIAEHHHRCLVVAVQQVGGGGSNSDCSSGTWIAGSANPEGSGRTLARCRTASRREPASMAGDRQIRLTQHHARYRLGIDRV
jgi:hypothetical protein